MSPPRPARRRSRWRPDRKSVVSSDLVVVAQADERGPRGHPARRDDDSELARRAQCRRRDRHADDLAGAQIGRASCLPILSSSRRLTSEDPADILLGATTTANSLAVLNVAAETGTPMISLAPRSEERRVFRSCRRRAG